MALFQGPIYPLDQAAGLSGPALCVVMKFQPNPISTRPPQKFKNSIPDRFVVRLALTSTPPMAMIRSTPTRAISDPVKKLGRYIASTCHWMTVAVSWNSKPQACIANGVAVMADKRPRTKDEFADVFGVGAAKLRDFAGIFLVAIEEFAAAE